MLDCRPEAINPSIYSGVGVGSSVKLTVNGQNVYAESCIRYLPKLSLVTAMLTIVHGALIIGILKTNLILL